MNNEENYNVAYEYTVRFYPRWFTWTQFHINSDNLPQSAGKRSFSNRLTGPLGMGPEYNIVVAINIDTIYTEAFLDVSGGPVYLTLPQYSYAYSVLQMDVYGNIFSTALSEAPPSTGGTYAFVESGYSAPLPAGVTMVEVPYTFTVLVIRIDKYTSQGVNVTHDAEAFRRDLSMQTTYSSSESGGQEGKTRVLPLSFFSPSVKLMADEGIAMAPEAFLTTLQEAMASQDTQPITEDDLVLIRRFNAAFAAARTAADYDSRPLTAIIRGAQVAHAALINRWQSHRGATNWIHFNNIGKWGTNYLDRAALTEYIQFGNNRQTTYYADAFVDGTGLPLNGESFAYTIRFEKDQLPQYKRFWSLTAYTPGAVELVPNSIDKYVVASYTPGLVTGQDGSVTIYVQADEPEKAKVANWLPSPKASSACCSACTVPREQRSTERTWCPGSTAARHPRMLPQLLQALELPAQTERMEVACLLKQVLETLLKNTELTCPPPCSP